MRPKAQEGEAERIRLLQLEMIVRLARQEEAQRLVFSDENYRSSELALQQAARGHQQFVEQCQGNCLGAAVCAGERAGIHHANEYYGRHTSELRSQLASSHAEAGGLPFGPWPAQCDAV